MRIFSFAPCVVRDAKYAINLKTDREELDRKAKERIKIAYSLEYISGRYTEIGCER